MMLNNETSDTGGSRGMESGPGMNLNIYSSTSIRRPMLLSMKTAPVLSTSPTKGKEMVDLINTAEYRIPELRICEKVENLFLGKDNNMIIIFDLTTIGSLVSSSSAFSSVLGASQDGDKDENANKKAKDIYRIHLSLPSTLVKRPKFHFEKLLQTVIDDSKRLKLLNLIDNCSKFLFFDGVSTLGKCSLTTYWLIKKFNTFLHEKLCKEKIDLFILEKMGDPLNSSLNDVGNETTSFSETPAKDSRSAQMKINLTVKVLPRSNEKMFIQSIKKDTIHYSPTSLKKFFKFDIPQNLEYDDDFLPIWLRPFGRRKESDVILQKLLSNFEFLENLELKRLERGLTVEQQRQAKQNSSSIPEKDLQRSKSYQKIYSLSSLQKEFRKQKKFNYDTNNRKTISINKSSSCSSSPCHEISDLKLSIPKEDTKQSSETDLPTFSVPPPPPPIVTSSINDSETTPTSPLHFDTDSDSLLTPMNHYEMSEGIRSFAKNRYSNILPYEHSRVKLQPSPLCGPPSISESPYDFSANDSSSMQTTTTGTGNSTASAGATAPAVETEPAVLENGCCQNSKRRRNSCSSSSASSSSSSSPASYFNQTTESVSRIEHKGDANKADPNTCFNDYFNANYLKIPQVNPDFEYIATQAPLPSTIDDFWKVISTNGVKVIISLNSNDELFMRKWDIYWNNNRSNQKYKIDMMESFENVCGVEGCILRIFSFYKNTDIKSQSGPGNRTTDNGNGEQNEVKASKLIVYQLQYTKWLDSCGIVMKDILDLYTIKNTLLNNPDEFIEDLRSHKAKKMSDYHQDLWSNDSKDRKPSLKQPPLLVHCSAGCGRTGVFITLDFLLNILMSPTNSNNKIDVWNMTQDLIFITVNELRKQRISMVQNLTQYITCYESILEYFSLKKSKAKKTKLVDMNEIGIVNM